MISFRATATASLLGLLVALAGCSAQTGATGSAGSAETIQAVDPAPAAQAVNFHGPGQEHLLVAALREPSLNLTAAQKTAIEGALTASSTPRAPSAEGKARMMALAAGVRAGKVDPSSVQAPNNDAERNAHIAASAKAIDTLHATLTPAQRRALVDAVSRRTEHRGPPPGMEANRDAKGERGHGGRGDHGPMGHLLAGLDLTQAQQDAIHTQMEAQKPTAADHEAMKKQFEGFHTAMQARLQTFANDSFDATGFVTPPAGAVMKGHEDRMAKDLAIITSVLDSAQREKLATRIEQGPPARPAVEQKVGPEL